MAEDQQEIIKQSVEAVFAVERSLADAEAQLMADERFKSFIQKQKEAQTQIADTWKSIEKSMIDNDIKSIKGDFGSITIAERTTYSVTDESKLPEEYFKRVPDTKKIGTAAALYGQPPVGVEKDPRHSSEPPQAANPQRDYLFAAGAWRGADAKSTCCSIQAAR